MAGGLVGEQQGGAEDEGPRQRRPLLLAERHLGGSPVGELLQAEPHDQRLGPFGQARGALPVGPGSQPNRELDVLADRELLDQAEVLGEHGHVVPREGRGFGQGDATPPNLPSVRSLPAAQRVQERRLAGAGRAHQRDNLVPAQVERHTLDGVDHLGTAVVRLGEVVDGHRGRRR